MQCKLSFPLVETVHEVALKDKEPDTQDADEVKVSGEGVGTAGLAGLCWPSLSCAGEPGFELGVVLFVEGPGAADGESPGGPLPAAGPAPGRDQREAEDH